MIIGYIVLGIFVVCTLFAPALGVSEELLSAISENINPNVLGMDM